MRNWTPDDIFKLRSKMNLSQPAFGNLLGVTGNYVYLLEKGVKQASKTLMLLLDCIEKQFKENERGKESDRHGKKKSKEHL